MNKKVLLGAAISLASLHTSAVPFQVLDARTMGMGGTGVASAPLSSAAVYNPALLSTVREDDHFTLNLRLGVYAGDEDEILEATDDFDPETKADDLDEIINDSDTNLNSMLSAITTMETAITNITNLVDAIEADPLNASDAQITQLNGYNDDLQGANTSFTNASGALNADAGPGGRLVVIVDDFTDYLENTLSESRLKGGGALGFNIAIPSKKFAVGVGIDTNISGSGIITVDSADTGLFQDYVNATATMVDKATNTTTGVGVGVTNFAADVGQLVTDIGNSDPNAVTQITTVENSATALNASLDDFQTTTIVGENSGNTIIENGEIAEGQEDVDLKSTIHVYGAAVTDIGISISREFMVMDRAISFGITPKLQKVDVFDFIAEVDGEDPDEPEGSPNKEIDFDEVEFDDYHKEYSGTNLDIGAAHKFGYNERWQGGLVVKNLLSKSYASERGQKVDIQPMVRAGLGYQNIDYWLKPKASVDLDLTENKATAFEDPTRYLALGGEIDLFRWIQLRAGYRTNLSGDDENIYTAGLGLSPFMVHLDLAGWVNTGTPEKEFGVAAEFGVEF